MGCRSRETGRSWAPDILYEDMPKTSLPPTRACSKAYPTPQLEPQACDQIFNTQGHLGTLLSSTTVPDDANVANLGPHLGTKSVDDVHWFLDCWFRPFLPSRGRLIACSLRFQVEACYGLTMNVPS